MLRTRKTATTQQTPLDTRGLQMFFSIHDHPRTAASKLGNRNHQPVGPVQVAPFCWTVAKPCHIDTVDIHQLIKHGERYHHSARRLTNIILFWLEIPTQDFGSRLHHRRQAFTFTQCKIGSRHPRPKHVQDFLFPPYSEVLLWRCQGMVPCKPGMQNLKICRIRQGCLLYAYTNQTGNINE